jgi:hypothetical protein
LTRSRSRLGPGDWIAWIRLVAAPFALLEVAIERGNYPEGDERWGWAIGAAFAAGAVAFFGAHRRRLAPRALAVGGLVFDGFEPSSPVRQLLILVVIEAALRYGRMGALWAATSAPALAVFEWRASERLDVPYDPGHVVFPIALQLLVGLIVGTLAPRAARDA